MALEHDEDGFWARRDGLELRVEGGAKPRERGRGFFEQAGVLVRIEVDDFDGFVGEIVGRGVQLMGQVKDSEEGRFAGFCDPDGNLFELIELPDWSRARATAHALGRARARAPAVDARAPAHGRLALRRARRHRPRRGAAHGLRGGALPEHRRVLGTRNGDVPDHGRHLHARLPLLRRQLRQARRSARPARARARRGRRRSAWG